MKCAYEKCDAEAAHIGARCEECWQGIGPGHDYCSDHYWYLRRYADNSSAIWWGDEGQCECQDCIDRLINEEE
jgi:hypothetical protein